MNEFQEVNQDYCHYFPILHPPSRSCVQVNLPEIPNHPETSNSDMQVPSSTINTTTEPFQDTTVKIPENYENDQILSYLNKKQLAVMRSIKEIDRFLEETEGLVG